MTPDDDFPEFVAGALARLPGVVGVALGGSRAQGTSRPDSDWDFSIYYRGSFDPTSIDTLGWDGQATELGGWGPLFNGGGWFVVEGRHIDIHYRDLDAIGSIQRAAERGEFTVEPLLFHQAGIPSYILLAELAMNRTLHGELLRPSYPDLLREKAPAIWWSAADLTLFYAKEGHARHGRVAQGAGLISTAGCQAAHAILAHRGQWITNEKQLLTKAGLRGLDDILSGMTGDPRDLEKRAIGARALIEDALTAAGTGVVAPR